MGGGKGGGNGVYRAAGEAVAKGAGEGEGSAGLGWAARGAAQVVMGMGVWEGEGKAGQVVAEMGALCSKTPGGYSKLSEGRTSWKASAQRGRDTTRASRSYMLGQQAKSTSLSALSSPKAFWASTCCR